MEFDRMCGSNDVTVRGHGRENECEEEKKCRVKLRAGDKRVWENKGRKKYYTWDATRYERLKLKASNI